MNEFWVKKRNSDIGKIVRAKTNVRHYRKDGSVREVFDVEFWDDTTKRFDQQMVDVNEQTATYASADMLLDWLKQEGWIEIRAPKDIRKVKDLNSL